MRFSLSREALLKPLQQVVNVVERRQTLPVLANLLVQVDNGALSLTGTDLEVEMVSRCWFYLVGPFVVEVGRPVDDRSLAMK